MFRSSEHGANFAWPFGPERSTAVPTGIGGCSPSILIRVGCSSDMSNSNNITGSTSLGTVGLEWQVLAFGNFDSVGNTDMILRDVNTAALQVYNISNNQITGSAPMGAVGLNWQFSGVGDFSSRPGESDMILRNIDTGGLQVYNIANNQITGSAFLGTVGVDWTFAGVAPISAPGESDLVLRNDTSGAFRVYNFAD